MYPTETSSYIFTFCLIFDIASFCIQEDLPDLLYVGETESIRQRLKQHRDKYKTLGYSFNAAVINVQNKSAARKIETMLINALKAKGLDIENDADSRHVLFSGSSK